MTDNKLQHLAECSASRLRAQQYDDSNLRLQILQTIAVTRGFNLWLNAFKAGAENADIEMFNDILAMAKNIANKEELLLVQEGY